MNQTCPCGGTLLVDPDEDNVHCSWCSAPAGYYEETVEYFSQEEISRRASELRRWRMSFRVARERERNYNPKERK